MASIGGNSSHRSLIALTLGLVIGFCSYNLFDFLIPQFPFSMEDSDEYFLDGNEFASNFTEHTHSFENSSVAKMLHKEVRVLCMVFTYPYNHQKKAIHVKNTWGRRCNKLLFMSTTADAKLETVVLNITEGRGFLWSKTKEGFKYIYEHHMNDADWFLKADDDTYIIMENLRYFLYPYSPETGIYFGARFKQKVKPNGYMSGGAGYVLSKEALRRFVTEALPDPKHCSPRKGGFEDAELGRCLQNVDVIAGDTRDEDARSRFFPNNVIFTLLTRPSPIFWYFNYIYYNSERRMDRISDFAIAFHYITPADMYLYEFFIYHLRPYGIVHTNAPLPKKLEIGETASTPQDPTTIAISLKRKLNNKTIGVQLNFTFN